MSASCPICRKSAAPRAHNTAFPFCSARCRQVDLGKWLSEDYRIATNESSDATSNENELAAGNRKETPS